MENNFFGYENDIEFINDILDDKLIVISDDEDDEINPNHFKELDIFLQNKMTFTEFCKKLFEYIDPHNAILITTRMLLMVEKAFVEEFGSNWNKLRRYDKRKKGLILQKFYENADTIIGCIQSEPEKYLRYVRELIVKKYSNIN